jgi:hypothetical protein
MERGVIMRHSLLISFVLLGFLLFGTISQVSALTFEELPISKSSEQWLIEIGKADAKEPELNEGKDGVFNTYSMTVKSTGGEEITNVRVEAFRDEPNSTTKCELFNSERHRLLEEGNPFHFSNFPISVNAKELEVVITWSKEGSDRKYKERFVFNQK